MTNSREKICEVLCHKNKCPRNFFNCNGEMVHRCKDLGKSFINNLNDNQVEYITEDLNCEIFLKACPGSGKTEVLAVKCAFETKQWKKKNQGIAILTFTNSAEDEIRNRINSLLNESLKYPHFVGTFTSWIHGYIANPFLSMVTNYKGDEERDKSIRLIESSCNSDFLNVYSSRYGYKQLGNIKAHEYFLDFKTDRYIYCGSRSYEGQEILQQLLNEDSWRNGDLNKLKKRFWENGFCLYEDVEYLVYLLLNKNKEIPRLVAQRFPVIMIDECQDLSFVQLEIIKLLHEQGCKIHLIGDLDQAIYGFRNIEPNDTLEFIDDLELKEMQLNQNYRSCQKIVNISNFVMNSDRKIIGCVNQIVDEPLVAILYNKDKEMDAVNEFNNLIKQNSICNENSRIIVRNNTLRNKLLGLKNLRISDNILEDLAKAIFMFQNEGSISDFKTSFVLLSKVIQKIYFKNIEHLNGNFFYKPIELEMNEWKETLSSIKNILISETSLLDFSKSWSEWKKLIEKVMERLNSNLPKLKKKSYDIGRIRNGNANKTVEEILFLTTNRIMKGKIETIHGCKGMSLDAVLFMSSYQANSNTESGAYWKQWFDKTIIEEKNRMAYVAFSRARHLLALGIPKPNAFSNEDKKLLENSGFKIIEL